MCGKLARRNWEKVDYSARPQEQGGQSVCARDWSELKLNWLLIITVKCFRHPAFPIESIKSSTNGVRTFFNCWAGKNYHRLYSIARECLSKFNFHFNRLKINCLHSLCIYLVFFYRKIAWLRSANNSDCANCRLSIRTFTRNYAKIETGMHFTQSNWATTKWSPTWSTQNKCEWAGNWPLFEN